MGGYTMDKQILQAQEIFKGCGFEYAICGGFALDMFVGKQLRDHGDFDMCFFKEDRQRVLQFLMDREWPIYGRFWEENKPITQYLFYKIEDLNDPELEKCGFWAVKPGGWAEMYPLERANKNLYSYKMHEPRLSSFVFIEVGFDNKEGDNYVVHDNPKVTRPMSKAIMYADGIPYLAPEIILFFKTDKFSATHPYLKPKMETDFKAVMPLLSDEQKSWLKNAIKTAHGDETPWLDGLL